MLCDSEECDVGVVAVVGRYVVLFWYLKAV